MADGLTTGVEVADGFDGEWRRYSAGVVLVLAIVGLGVVTVVRAGQLGEGPPSASEPVVTEVPVTEPSTPAPSPSAAPSPTSTPTPTATSTEAPTETVLFEGGPATGPWQQLGTVAEITHPDAPASARYSYTNFWSDPAEENQPDELWDQLVIEVTDQLAELGTPVDRPAFGGAPGSEPFNSFGGVQDIYVETEMFTAEWSAIYEDGRGVHRAAFWFIVSFDGMVLDRGEPFIATDDGQVGPEESAAASVAALREWTEARGYQCDDC